MNRIWLPLIFIAFLSAPGLAQTGGIAVNEYYNGNGGVSGNTKMSSDEYVEFAITERMTAGALAGLTFGDSNSSGTMLQSVFNFDQNTLSDVLRGAGLTEFLPGTMIVVKGSALGPQNLSYNPLATNTSNSDAWSIELVAGQGALDNAERRINGNFAISTTGDVVWVSSESPPVNNTDTAGFISAIGHGSTTGTIARAVIADFGSDSILAGNVNTGQAVANVGGAKVSLQQSSTTTMGQPNSTANASWISGLRNSMVTTVPEPSRTMLLLVGLAASTLQRKRPIPAS